MEDAAQKQQGRNDEHILPRSSFTPSELWTVLPPPLVAMDSAPTFPPRVLCPGSFAFLLHANALAGHVLSEGH